MFGECDLAQHKQAEIARSLLMFRIQRYFFAMRVVGVALLGRVGYSESKEDERIVFRILQDLRLEPFAFHNLREKSGSERPHVFIARAMAQQSRIIALGELTSSPDPHNQLFVLHMIANLAKAYRIAVVMTIHDLNLVLLFYDKLPMRKDAKGQTDLNEAAISAMYQV